MYCYITKKIYDTLLCRITRWIDMCCSMIMSIIYAIVCEITVQYICLPSFLLLPIPAPATIHVLMLFIAFCLKFLLSKIQFSALYWVIKQLYSIFLRDKIGKIIKAAPFQSKLTPGTMARVEPNRRWFGNTRVITQTALQTFQDEMEKVKKDPYKVVMKQTKLPITLLNETAKVCHSIVFLCCQIHVSRNG